jgi:hypothetical protein
MGEANLQKCMVRRPTAREKLMVKKACVNVSGLFVEMCHLAMMRYAAYLSFETPRPCKGQFGNKLQIPVRGTSKNLLKNAAYCDCGGAVFI